MRNNIHRSSLSSLLQKAEISDELKSSQQRKQLKYMTNQYRRQIFKINDNLATGVPKSILLQAKVAEKQHRLKTEILKRKPGQSVRSQMQSATHLFKKGVNVADDSSFAHDSRMQQNATSIIHGLNKLNLWEASLFLTLIE